MESLSAIVFAAALWWLGTGLLVLLVRRPQGTYNASLLGACLLFGLGAACVDVGASALSPIGAYLGFFGAVTLWACLEMANLLGRLTGPEKLACPTDASALERFRRGIGVGLYHDLAVVACGVLLWIHAFATDAAAGALTYSVLWFMRWSAKLNLFLGVPNFSSELLPNRLSYLTTYMRQSPASPLLPLSLLVAALVVAYAVYTAMSAATGYARTAATLAGTLAALGLLEHLLLVLPFRDAKLWDWFARGH